MPRKKCKKIISEDSRSVNTEITTNEKTIKQPEVFTIMSIFRDIHDIYSHERLLTQLLLEFYNELQIDEFCQDFFECMRHIMIYQDRIRTEIPLLFCVKFVIMCLKKELQTAGTTKSFLLLKRLVKFITYYDNMSDTNIRFHSVQAARLLLTELTDDIPVPEIIFEKIQTLLLKRFWDIKSYVRAEAARASSRLQDPSDPDCAIVVALMHLSRFDGSHTVRLAAMQALAITTKTLPCIVSRARDINDLVRKKSFDLMSKWKILKPLTVSKRLQIIESGLTDKSDIVKSACKDLLKVWLVASNDDPVVLLKRFDVENKEETTELAFTQLLQTLDSTEFASVVGSLLVLMDERLLVREENLNAETSFLWKHLIVFISERSEEYGDYLEKMLPSVSDFELYLRRLFQKPIEQNVQKEISLDEYAEYCTIIKQLLPIVKYIDVFDPFNRKKIIDLIKWAMSSTDIPFNYVEQLMKLFVHLESNNVKICDETVALINDLLFDSDNTVIISQSMDEEIVADKHVSVAPRIGVDFDSTVDHTVINKEALRKKRIEIAQLDVEINELKEMITTSMQAKEFDGVQSMVYQLKILESKKTHLNKLKDQLMTPVEENRVHETVIEPIDTAAFVKPEIHDIPLWMTNGMESRIVKANIMTISMIQECNLLWSMPSSLRSLFDNVIVVSVRHTDPCVRQKAILSLGLCCLLDKELAVKYYPIFLKSLEVDHDPIKEVAVKSLIDIFIRFGIEPFQDTLIAAKENSRIREQSSFLSKDTDQNIKEESFISCNTTCSVALTEDEQNKCVAELINPIILLLNSDKTELQTTACIGLSKLLYHHKLLSSKLLSRLLLLWFNPDTENNVALRQHLGGFFSNYTLMSSDNQQSITNCFMITMKTLFKAPATNPLSEVDINNVVEFFLRVTDSKYLLENRIGANKVDDNWTVKDMSQLNNPCHYELAITISNQILKAPLSSEVKYYVTMLVRLRLTPKNIDALKAVESMVSAMISRLKDKKCLQLLEKFHKEVSVKLNVSSAETLTSANQSSARTVLEDTTDSLLLLQTPISKPKLLEINTVGKPQDGRFLSHTTICADNTLSDNVSVLSAVDLDKTLLDTTTTNKALEEAISVSTCAQLGLSAAKKIADEDVFKKPSNVRVTRSCSRYSECSSSSSSATSSKLYKY